MNAAETIIVTRHPSLVALLIERGLATADTPVITHATRDDVRGKHVIGVLPHHLSAAAATVTEIPMAMTPEDRSAAQAGDLPLSRIRAIAGDAATYLVIPRGETSEFRRGATFGEAVEHVRGGRGSASRPGWEPTPHRPGSLMGGGHPMMELIPADSEPGLRHGCEYLRLADGQGRWGDQPEEYCAPSADILAEDWILT